MKPEVVHENLELALSSLSLTPGRDKAGQAERAHIHFKPGEITALLGPTGAGKSRFLADIEALAAGDTPTGRTVLLNGTAPDEDTRFDLQGRLVAQLTQNMNFVLDMGVMDFLRTHALSREVADAEGAAQRVFEAANQLAGEPFFAHTQLTQLSGGQSRALMIADTALLSWSPVLLIDEIENAGVDKRKALDLLLASDKIIVMATHDPVLALAADRRLVFEQGAVAAVLARTPAEDSLLARLMDMERQWSDVREALRKGADMAAWADC